jgi:DNA topoisomerase-1
VTVRSGRYGPYVNHGKLNATLPRNLRPEDVTMPRAVELLAEKADKIAAGEGPMKRSRARKAPPARKPAAKASRKAAAGSK